MQNLKNYAEFKNRSEGDITKLANSLLWEALTKEMLVRYTKPYLETLGTKNESIFVKDKENERIYEIMLQNFELYCTGDKRNDCEHTRYAWAISELGKLIDFKKDIVRGNWDPNVRFVSGVELKSDVLNEKEQETESKARL